MERKKQKYDYRPLPDFLTIRESDIEGLGVFAKKDIVMLDYEYTAIGNTHLKFHDKVVRTPLGGFINNSSDPNCTLYKTFIPYSHEKCKDYYYVGLYPLRDIQAGEEITLDYNKCFGVLGMDCEF